MLDDRINYNTFFPGKGNTLNIPGQNEALGELDVAEQRTKSDFMKRIVYPGWGVPVELYVTFKPDDMLDYGFFTASGDYQTMEIGLDQINDRFLEDKIPDEPCLLIAHSLGSLLALRSSQLSDNIKAVVVIGGFAKFTQSEPDYPDGKPASGIVMMQRMMNLSVKMVLDKFHQAMVEPASYDIAFDGKPDVARLTSGLQYLVDTDFRDCLKEIKVPVMIIHGEQDQIVSAKLAEFMAENIPNSILHLIPDAGHALPFTHTQECLDLIEGFIF